MENFELFFSFGLLVVLMVGLIIIALRIRKTGGTMTTTLHGVIDAFYDKEK